MSKATRKGVNGQQQSELNLIELQKWIDQREKADDWKDYVWRGEVCADRIAKGARIPRSSLYQTESFINKLAEIEAVMRAKGLLLEAPEQADATLANASDRAYIRQMMSKLTTAETRVKTLESQLATTRAALRDANSELGRYKHLNDHLGRTGRAFHP